MKKWIVLSIMLAIFIGWAIVQAGEKEDLQREIIIRQLIIRATQAEFNLAQKELQELQPKLDAILKAEQQKDKK